MGLWAAGLTALVVAAGSVRAAPAADLPPEAGLYYYPNYPRDFLIEGIRGSVKVRYLVGESGEVGAIRILSASQPAFAESVKRALGEWRFYPAEKEGKPVAVWLEQQFTFAPSRKSYYSIEPLNPALQVRHPVPWTGQRPVYPQELKAERVIGHADTVITVKADGRVARAVIESATHPAFEAPALRAARQWTFHPVDPRKLYEAEHGKAPAFLAPDYGSVDVRLTFLFHPDAPPGGETTAFPGQVSDTLKARKRR